ncbi:hypothetical protein NLX86_26100 [Streptomyces sp. A3M-1-3]|uniref:hypothetical protein n=1 Tax=Streptomyces sp. A3M-1-3 TaxID=2962044 RepID=UPI0020B8DCA7|nr:hypothetical protein [Streptomyces sp. A3M-1-3]MCP3821441.1 hypothetical protein [Streptomyces sp. A3M-1-3]
MKRQRSRSGRTTLAAAAAMCAVAAAPGAAYAAGPDDVQPYKTAADAKPVKGAASSAEGPRLEPGGIYTDSIKPGEERFYTVDLDAKSNVFVSAVGAPAAGSKVAFSDGIDIVLMSTGGDECSSSDDTDFGSEQARPIADYAHRRIREDGDCQQAGPYYVKVVRTSEKTSGPEAWPVELAFMQEPGLRSGASATAPPTSWNSASPAPASGTPQKREGGTGFNDARALGDGVWKDTLAPGQTRFYRVPLDWGQQLTVNAELANAKMTKDSGFAAPALTTALYNTARGPAVSENTSYDGKQAADGLGPTAPVAYSNRFSNDSAALPMRFSGWYYLAVTLDKRVGEFTTGTVPLTLRVTIGGKAAQGPDYDGDAAAAGFGLTGADREAAEKGQTAVEAGESGTMKVVAAVGIGAGTVLVLGLGAWTMLARRRGSAAPAGPVSDGPTQQQYGPSAW